MDDSGATTVVHPAAVHPPVGAMLSQAADLAYWGRPEGADWPSQRASKRARPAYSSTSYSRSPSRLRHDGHSARQDKDLSAHMVEHNGLNPWPSSKLMTSTTGTAAVLSSMCSGFGDQEMATMGGQQDEYTCEPAILPAELNLTLGGETGRAMPNMELQPFSPYTTAFPFPPYPPASIPSFTHFIPNNFQYYPPPAPAYDFTFTMTWDGHHHQTIPPDGYNQQDQGHFSGSEPVDDTTYLMDTSNAHLFGPSTCNLVCSHDTNIDPVMFYGGVLGDQVPFGGTEFRQADSSEGFEQASDVATPSISYQIPSQFSLLSRSSQSRSIDPLTTSPQSGGFSPLGSQDWEFVDRSDSSSASSSVKSSRRGSNSPDDKKGNKKGGRTHALDPVQRDQASNTRRTGACLRCSFQRNKCEQDPRDPSGICLTCQKIYSNNSKKIINNLCCVRWKLVAVTMFRTGGLNFTSRPGWQGAAMKDLRPEDWANDRIITIRITLGYCDEPIELRVRRFKPIPGVDQTSRLWKDSNGVQQETEIAPYALYDIQKTRSVLLRHITNNAYAAVRKYADTENDVHPLVRDTYKAAWDHMRSVEYVTENNIDLREFMEGLFRLWFASRHTMGSAWIEGKPGTEETLWMKPDPRPDYVLPGKISTPRLVSQQFDAINYNTMLSPWRNSFLTSMWQLVHVKTDPKVFFTIYLATFILLHEASKTSKDRYWHAQMKQQQGNGGGRRYDMESFMENLHEGANIVLWCWHYFRSKFNPFDSDWELVQHPDDKSERSETNDEETIKKEQKQSGTTKREETDEKDEKSERNRKRKKREDMGEHLTMEQMDLMRRLAEVSSHIKNTDDVPDVPKTQSETYGWDNLVFDPMRPCPLIWERDLHFTGQMFVEGWSPRPTWNRSLDLGPHTHM